MGAAALLDPFSGEAKAFPEEVWRYIRLQYGARRGMIVRILAILIGSTVAALGVRKALGLPIPLRWAGAIGAFALGFASYVAMVDAAKGEALRAKVLALRAKYPR